jgi:thiol-disulfide isomerase/thioredoxin
MRHSALLAVLAILGLFVLNSSAFAADPEVRLRVVKLAEFEAALAKHKGRIVVVDYWATYCVPCMKEFPHLVELHKKHNKDGVTCISMSVDDRDDQPDGRDLEADLKKFLTKQNATFENFLIAEKPAVWSNAWKFQVVPAVRVYGRDGKLARQFDYEDQKSFDHTDVEAFVQKLLGEKK